MRIERYYSLQTSRVRSGDDESVEAFTEHNVRGNHLFRVDEGMSCLTEVNDTLVVQDGHRGLHGIGKLCLGEDEIKLHGTFVAGLYALVEAACLCRKLIKDTLDFLSFRFPRSRT